MYEKTSSSVIFKDLFFLFAAAEQLKAEYTVQTLQKERKKKQVQPILMNEWNSAQRRKPASLA